MSVKTLRTAFLGILPYVVGVAPVALYQVLYFRGYYPITEGWFSEYAHLIKLGAVPYRDFYLLVPPLYPLQLAGFQVLFGDGIFALRVLGIVVTCGICLALLDILRMFFNPWIAAFAAAAGAIYYQSGVAYFGYDFTQFLTLYLLIAALLLMHSIRVRAGRADAVAALLCGASGIFLGLAVLIKQSNAVIAAFGLIVAGIVVAFILYRPRIAILRTATLVFGFCVPIAAMVVWLVTTRAIAPFWADVFTHAASAKGGIGIALFGWIWHYFTDPPGYVFLLWQTLVRLFEIVLVMAFVSALLELAVAIEQRRQFRLGDILAAARRITGLSRAATSPGRAAFISAIGLALLCAIVFSISRYECTDCLYLSPIGDTLRYAITSWTVTFYLVALAVAATLLLRSRTIPAARFFMVAMLGIGLLFGNGTSGGVSEISLFLGLAMLLAYLMESWLPYVVPVFLPMGIALWICAFYAQSKFYAPYTWWLLASPPVRATGCADARGVLRDLCMPPEEYGAITRIENEIFANSGPHDAIYVYPHMPIFYLMTNRAPYDRAVVSWFDFMNDSLANDVANKLQTQPPPVIVVGEIPELVMTAHEKAFRAGKPLAQHRILAAIDHLEAQGIIERIDRVQGLNKINIDVYRRVPPARKPVRAPNAASERPKVQPTP